MFYKHILTAAIASVISAQASALDAQSSEGNLPEEKKSTKLNMVQVVGKATGGVDDIISRDMLDNIQANDLTDIFSLNPEVSAGGAVSIAQKVYVRNVGEDMLNISVDGAEQAGAVFHHAGRIVIEPDLLQQVEVEAGAGSATAGFGALGGAVRFVTKDPEDLLRGNETAGATIKSTYYSNGESTKHSATAYATDEKGTFSGLVNFISADLNNREDGNGDEITGSESENTIGFAKLVSNITDKQKFSLSYESLKQEGEMLYKPEWIPSAGNPLESTTGERDTIIANYAYNLNPLVHLSVNAYQTNVSQSRTHQVWYPNGDEITGEVETQAFTLQNKSTIGSNTIIYGINYREDTAKFDELGTIGKETGEVSGLYIQDITQVNEQLTITAGLRYDDYSLDDINGLKITSSGFAPNLSANYAFNSELSLSAGYAEAIRGATVKDAYLLWTGGYSNDPDLKEEKAKNIEVALDYHSGPYTGTLGIFHSTIEDAIGSAAPWIRNMSNQEEDIKSLGYFAKFGYSQDALNVNASFFSADTEVNDTPVTRYANGSTATSIGDTLVVDANYQVSPELYLGWVGQIVNGIEEFDQDLNGTLVTLEKEGYSTHDLYLRWSPMVNEMLVFDVALKNIFDEQYINHASPEDYRANAGYEAVSGQYDAGRDIRLSVAVKF